MAFSHLLHPRRLLAAGGELTLAALFGHWREALTTCLPAALRRLLAPRERRLILVPQGEEAMLYSGESLAEREALGRIDRHLPAAALGNLLAVTKKGERRRMLILLPDSLVLARHVSLPGQVRKNLAQVLTYELDRLTPFRADQVYFDFRLAEHQPESGQVVVQLALCRRDLLQGWIERLRGAGNPPDEILWDSAWPRANLLPPGERPKRGARLPSLAQALWLLVALLMAAVLIGPLWQKERMLEWRERDLRRLKGEAEEVYSVREAIEQARQGSVAVLERKAEQPRMIELLRELTDRLPDGTWVQNLDYREGEVQIRGESSQAASLIGLLEKAPGFEGVAFRSPVVQVASTRQERFHIGFRYTREEPAP